MAAAGDVLLAPELLFFFYKSRRFQPAWILPGGLSPEVQELIGAVREAEADGLTPSDYHLQTITDMAQSVGKKIKKRKPFEPEAAADFDLLLTDAFLTYAAYLAHGKVDGETLQVAWQGSCIDENLARLLDESLAAGRVRETLQSLPPQHPFYSNLKQALAQWRELDRRAKWTVFPGGPPLKKGDQGGKARRLRERLLFLGDLGRDMRRPKDVFDGALEDAVRSLQSRYGLEATGVVDPPTRAALDRPPRDSVQQIAINLERWRWMPHELGRRFIYVNIANFELEVYENGRRLMAMKVVAGMEGWPTPDFSGRMTHVVVNPYWTVPIPVLLKELVNYIVKDRCYLENNKMVLLRNEDQGEVEIDPASVDWAKLDEKNLNFLVRQAPGPLNVLGRLKFVFPNKYGIFLHDTPYQADFAKTTRAFSHGCVRAERPVELAAYVLRGRRGWDERSILEAIDANIERTVKLVEPLDIIFLYCTAWPDERGVMQFRPDVYERDRKLIEALGQAPPRPGDFSARHRAEAAFLAILEKLRRAMNH